MVAQHFCQAVKWDSAVQMMHMVNSDVASKPHQNGWQIIMRTAVQRCFMDLPVCLGIPVGILKLVLYIEQPNPERRSHAQGGKENPQNRRKAPKQEYYSQRRQDHRIGPHRTDPIFYTRVHQAQW